MVRSDQWSHSGRRVLSTANGTSVDPTPITIFTNGTTGGRKYTGGYSTTVEPGPSGYVASWGACLDTNLTNDCDHNKNVARFDLLIRTSANGTTWSTPKILGDSSAGPKATLNDEPSIVVTSGKTYIQYNIYNAAYTAYDIYARVGTGNPQEGILVSPATPEGAARQRRARPLRMLGRDGTRSATSGGARLDHR